MTRTPPSVPLSHRTGYLLNNLASRIRVRTEASLTRFGLSPRLFGALETVAATGPLPQIELSRALCVDRTSTVDVVDRLESLGLVERGPDPKDRRAHALTVTPHGREVLRVAGAAVEAVQREFLACLSDRESATLRKLLLKLINSTEQDG